MDRISMSNRYDDCDDNDDNNDNNCDGDIDNNVDVEDNDKWRWWVSWNDIGVGDDGRGVWHADADNNDWSR